MKPPADCLRVTVWAAWVIGADNRDGRNERLSRVPEILRAAVRKEVVWYFERTFRTP